MSSLNTLEWYHKLSLSTSTGILPSCIPFCNYYYYYDDRYHNYLLERQNLDRRRIEDAYFQFAVLHVCSWYPDHFKIEKVSLHNNTSTTLQEIVTNFHGIFMKKYSSKRLN